MPNTRLVIAPLLLASLSACSTYVPPPSKPTATLVMYMENETPTPRMRVGMAVAYADSECGTPSTSHVINSAISMEDVDEIPRKQIAAEQEFTFAMGASHVLWGGNSGCSVTATFTPKAGQTYDARMYIRGNSQRCEMIIVDQDNHEVPSTRPAYSCMHTLNGISKNGQGWYRSIRVGVR
ncbi:hypothetical protein [Massilia aquatica]|uniref:Lipoprotein n=1 Tax=Massilia aquatica TaxID=2609000 RepID=A0ABX0MGU1_9BURK|nr:hypothetical protein [Massilia aquatica]NHZ41361.1 hypothetical protein [Massilia aquatica]